MTPRPALLPSPAPRRPAYIVGVVAALLSLVVVAGGITLVVAAGLAYAGLSGGLATFGGGAGTALVAVVAIALIRRRAA